ncbi:MAG: hypothetical protein E4H07_08890 [Nitrosomonadales bacterium]|nr:MAG: hypothetical protein E4H07_08890 [Nitrosomonadales bacterium]
MNLKEYIEMGEDAAGNQVKLASYLEQNDSNMRKMKQNKRCIPDPMCIKLAHLIGVDPLHVIAASNLVTEKNSGRRKLLESCLVAIN